jgi:apolipoprotein D and lipocalin family protein
MKVFALFLAIPLFSGCLGYPDRVVPVGNFEVHRYLGQWYEIARLDHRFERGLQQVSAGYSLNPDGSLKVVNRGFATEDGTWQEAEGRAVFVRGPDQGYLKVSFFGPFYASYVIFELDQAGYQYAFVSGADLDYLWLLSRTPTVSEALKAKFVAQAKALGFDTEALIWVRQQQGRPGHEPPAPPAG